jgi:hypothetical protein
MVFWSRPFRPFLPGDSKNMVIQEKKSVVRRQNKNWDRKLDSQTKFIIYFVRKVKKKGDSG